MFNHPAWARRIDLSALPAIVQALSPPRLRPYGLHQDHAALVVARHTRNILLCEAIYPTLHLLEIILRNRIHDAFRRHFGADDWYLQSWLNAGHASLVATAGFDLRQRGRPAEPDRMVAALGFGFWCGKFHGAYESGPGPWPALLRDVFPDLPKRRRTRSHVRSRLEEARLLRNRVFHHERIASYADLRERQRRLAELLGWLSRDARTAVADVCRFHQVLTEPLEFA